MNALTVNHLSFIYPSGTKALDDVSLSVEEGQSVAILGSNGAGKSTLLDVLLGWQKSAQVSLYGKPISSYGRKELGRTLALVPQFEQYNFSFSLIDYVLFGRSPYLSGLGTPSEVDAEIAYQALYDVGLVNYAERHITTLSGGEHQLLLLARAIAQQSSMLLLDEPTSALDPANRKRVLTILKQLHAKGKTLLFTTHDANLAYELASHVAMVKKGSLLCYGPKEEVVNTAMLTTLYDTELTVAQVGTKTLIY
ncbi:MAG: ABC transporter ATP-binding protein [Sphaerochaeta sp.]|uniref:ABC transporter ATP-binding protein n=1 Tax=Sphaerochaeta sp. S2 TaxID=2798868 RepID=UPI0018E9FE34|nr:ABC transporter ATP-binding protein [Sphaerochaeta sp. S2]MCK9349362.1 ABC transporter ATP-binding protein [Sphaerochaeta sp.]MBJ2357886.1 ABC transporter ATP-binding protein [Sphaerochaeta sp. S2]MDD4301275.1 ABC transporter ATP-binding protein [Sphaerochaeta sp.]MDD4646766.1 ABC transporter ATP-binding protein [Sphaerochaeta sp.]MDY0243409.1 ABC transporter ATP-binding protein [Sphaerochaeta sp.]